ALQEVGEAECAAIAEDGGNASHSADFLEPRRRLRVDGVTATLPLPRLPSGPVSGRGALLFGGADDRLTPFRRGSVAYQSQGDGYIAPDAPARTRCVRLPKLKLKGSSSMSDHHPNIMKSVCASAGASASVYATCCNALGGICYGSLQHA